MIAANALIDTDCSPQVGLWKVVTLAKRDLPTFSPTSVVRNSGRLFSFAAPMAKGWGCDLQANTTQKSQFWGGVQFHV